MVSETPEQTPEAVAPPNGKDETPDRVAELSKQSAASYSLAVRATPYAGRAATTSTFPRNLFSVLRQSR